MTYTAFVSAVLALLLAPGPTNTLIGIAAARGGIGAILRLLPAELLGYLAAILPLSWLGAEFLARHPDASIGLKVVAAGWVMFLAIRLWKTPDDRRNDAEIDRRRIFMTTLLNPKALIFGLVLLPVPSANDFVRKLALFCLLVAAVAIVWGAMGQLTQTGTGSERRLILVQRAASVWLAFISISLITSVFGV